jgi:hypothetical protein
MQLREVQPAHKSDRFTVAQAIRAFRQVRGDTPKPGLFNGSPVEPAHRDTSSARLVLRDESGSIAAETARAGERSSYRTRRR